ncbi:hypothetical protein D0T50_10165 [Bacteroides sp. 214]|uniref:hypothetical protein n=1 Tax=Bacteroides sp. 214 TaxID=2302935 RepID=UPI0013CF69A2|nr:hypothetical protein [Bacteroides sp. 214]NDW13258.1 hypothetical protein [Bacteroides sp. 214]
MISRDHIVSLLFFIVLCCISCSISKSGNKPIIDIDGDIIIAKIETDKVVYVRKDGKRIEAYTKGIDFVGGKEALKAYLDSTFYNNPNYSNYSEFNSLESFFVLLDANLNIKEVRIMSRVEGNSKRYYDTIFIDALNNTQNRWHKEGVRKKWYCFFYRQRVY